MDDAHFKALTDRAGFSLDDAEFADLKARFEAAMDVLRPLRDLELADDEMAIAFSPEPEPTRDRS